VPVQVVLLTIDEAEIKMFKEKGELVAKHSQKVNRSFCSNQCSVYSKK